MRGTTRVPLRVFHCGEVHDNCISLQEAARSYQNAVGEANEIGAAFNLLLCRCLLADGEAAKEAFHHLLMVRKPMSRTQIVSFGSSPNDVSSRWY